ncbi:MAG: oxidoreductase [Polyangiaceae bacterium]|nr:oxidoreductase [Polyangiaceae bacterium]
MRATRTRPRLAVWKFASCDGCQLSLLDCEDELLAITEQVEIAYFLEASRNTSPGPYDVSLVEGSITTHEDERRIQHVREQSKWVVTLGACATAGGIQALRNGRDLQEFASLVYAHPEYLDSLATSTPIAEHIRVDFELRGCPIDKQQLLEVLSALLIGRKPNIAAHSVCVECKLAGNVCVLVSSGEPCLGPITHAGCGALCPSYDRACYGCFGPAEAANPSALSRRLLGEAPPTDQRVDVPRDALVKTARLRRLLQTFNTLAPEFRKESLRHG